MLQLYCPIYWCLLSRHLHTPANTTAMDPVVVGGVVRTLTPKSRSPWSHTNSVQHIDSSWRSQCNLYWLRLSVRRPTYICHSIRTLLLRPRVRRFFPHIFFRNIGLRLYDCIAPISGIVCIGFRMDFFLVLARIGWFYSHGRLLIAKE